MDGGCGKPRRFRAASLRTPRGSTALSSVMRPSQRDLHAVVRDLDTGSAHTSVLGAIFVENGIGVVDVDQYLSRRCGQGREKFEHALRAIERPMAHVARMLLRDAERNQFIV